MRPETGMSQGGQSPVATFSRLVQYLYQPNPSESGSRTSSFLTPLIVLCIRVGAMLGVYLILRQWLFRIGYLPEANYSRSVITLELIKQIGWSWIALCVMVGLLRLVTL